VRIERTYGAGVVMDLTPPIRIGMIAAAVGIALAITAVRACGSVPMPPKPPPPSTSLANSKETLRQATQTESLWAAGFDADAASAGVSVPSVSEMSRKLVAREDEGLRSLAPGEPPIDAAGLRLSAIAAGGTLSLVIENRTATDLAYRVATTVRPTANCSSRSIDGYNANVVAPGDREVRSECSYHDGMSLEISGVETVELVPLQALYVSKVSPSNLGADARLAVGHEPKLPAGQAVCNIPMPQSMRAASRDGTIRWRDLVDFYARHSCDTYSFPMEYRAFRKDGERPLPAAQ
jgi:hypothetical protein